MERLDKPIADTKGAVARPFRAVDTLAVMERRGSITNSMRIAGEVFREYFTRAHLAALRAADLGRMRYPSRNVETGLGAEHARERVWRAIVVLGGLTSPAGSCLWHVVGLEETLKQWALQRSLSGLPMKQETASGVMIAALGMLEEHWHGRGEAG